MQTTAGQKSYPSPIRASRKSRQSVATLKRSIRMSMEGYTLSACNMNTVDKDRSWNRRNVQSVNFATYSFLLPDT